MKNIVATKKEYVSGLLIWALIGFSIFLIVKFFDDYDFIFLIAAIIVPIILGWLSADYCTGVLIVILIVVGGGAGFFLLEGSYAYLSGSIAVYMIGLKIIRHINGMSGDYTFKEGIRESDLLFLIELLNSEWYETNRNKSIDEIDEYSLIGQDFFQQNIPTIIKHLFYLDKKEVIKGEVTLELLSRFHAIVIIDSLPKPIIINSEGLVSVGTQMLIDLFNSHVRVSNFDKLVAVEKHLIIETAQRTILQSQRKYGIVKDEAIQRLKNHLNNIN